VLFHETPTSVKAFANLSPLLAKHYEVVCFDTPGYGNSDPAPESADIPDYAEVFAEAIRSLELGPLALVGVHTGADFASHLAASQLNGEVRALVLSGLPWYPAEVRNQKLAGRRNAPELRADGSHFAELWPTTSSISVEHRTNLTTAILSNTADPFSAYSAVFRYDPQPWLSQITCPTLLLNHPADILVPADDIAMSEIPNVQKKYLDSELTPLYWSAPEEFAASIITFLNESTTFAA